MLRIDKEKIKMDKFYTKPDIAKNCCSLIDFSLYDSIIEPSAGSGVFLNFIEKEKIYAFDLFPENENVLKQDFFSLDLSNFKKPLLIIGNPPFGKKSKLAIDFFNKAAEFADTIAFIFPLQFRKWSVQNKLNKSYYLEVDVSLPENSFFYGNKEFNIGCCFQIWNNRNFKNNFKDLRINKKPLTKIDDFEMWQYNNTKEALKYFNKKDFQWDFAVPRQGFYDYSIRETEPKKLSKKIQWIFFKAKSEEVLNKLLKLDFEKISKKNTTIPGFGKADVIEEYENIYGKI